jgi:hypothetical protein
VIGALDLWWYFLNGLFSVLGIGCQRWLDCGDKYKVGLVQALFFGGCMIGQFLSTSLSLSLSLSLSYN